MRNDMFFSIQSTVPRVPWRTGPRGPRRKLFLESELQTMRCGMHSEMYQRLGAHPEVVDGQAGVRFAVWAPNAIRVSIVGNFNRWDSSQHQMRPLGSSGVWETFIPGLRAGELYKYAIRRGHHEFFKADPYASLMEAPPETSSIVFKSTHKFRDRAWMAKRQQQKPWQEPLSIYEVHLGSWRRVTEEDGRPLTYREIAPQLAEYVLQNGFTHVEFLPLKEHPYGP